MKTAVTGAAGFIGTNLVNLLVDNGHEVIAIDRVVPASPETREAVTWVSGDVLDPDSMTKALDGVEVVYHLRPLSPSSTKTSCAGGSTPKVPAPSHRPP